MTILFGCVHPRSGGPKVLRKAPPRRAFL